MSQLDKTQILLKYCLSKERQQGYQIEFMQLCLCSKQVNTSASCASYAAILNLTDLTSAEHILLKQKITEKFWLCKGTYWAVIIVKSVKVRQNTFCMWDIKINWFQFACNGLTITKMFVNPRLEKRVLQTCVCFLWEIKFTARIGIEPCGNQKQHSKKNEKKIRKR